MERKLSDYETPVRTSLLTIYQEGGFLMVSLPRNHKVIVDLFSPDAALPPETVTHVNSVELQYKPRVSSKGVEQKSV